MNRKRFLQVSGLASAGTFIPYRPSLGDLLTQLLDETPVEARIRVERGGPRLLRTIMLPKPMTDLDTGELGQHVIWKASTEMSDSNRPSRPQQVQLSV